MAFVPSFYEKPQANMQTESLLSDEEWKQGFVAHMIEEGTKCADDGFKPEVPDWARQMADSYVKDRAEYVSPEEAADTDISYWESEE
jgi:hypothetical protein